MKRFLPSNNRYYHATSYAFTVNDLVIFPDNLQDCNDEQTKNVIESYKEATFMRQPDQSEIFVLPKEKKFKGYYKIARHYGWALNTTFKAGFDYVIIVEGMNSFRSTVKLTICILIALKNID